MSWSKQLKAQAFINEDLLSEESKSLGLTASNEKITWYVRCVQMNHALVFRELRRCWEG